MFQVALSYEVAGSSGAGLSLVSSILSVVPTTMALPPPLPPPEPPHPVSRGVITPSRAGSTRSLRFIVVVLLLFLLMYRWCSRRAPADGRPPARRWPGSGPGAGPAVARTPPRPGRFRHASSARRARTVHAVRLATLPRAGAGGIPTHLRRCGLGRVRLRPYSALRRRGTRRPRRAISPGTRP